MQSFFCIIIPAFSGVFSSLNITISTHLIMLYIHCKAVQKVGHRLVISDTGDNQDFLECQVDVIYHRLRLSRSNLNSDNLINSNQLKYFLSVYGNRGLAHCLIFPLSLGANT